MLTFNGKPFNANDFGEALQKAAVKSIAAQLREKAGTVRHPETGEFPTVVITGDTLATMSARVEGSPELIDAVKERFGATTKPEPAQNQPKVFLSYAWEDRALASRIAHALQSNGIDTWWAEWCMSAGDSLRQKIDGGLGDCTHFVVLLTSASLKKPWVNQEMDAGLMLKLQSNSKFIPLRHQLPAEELPPLLRGMLSPSVDENAADIQQLINDIHGVTKKPPLGPAPAAVEQATKQATGYSAAATAIAKLFVQETKYACNFDPQTRLPAVIEKTGLSRDDVVDALHELRGLVKIHGGEQIWAKQELFAEFDKFWMAWDPATDALQVAADMIATEDYPSAPANIAIRYGWEPRRLNPAMAYLIARDLVAHFEALAMQPWLTVQISKNDATRRFVKSRS